MQPDLSVVIPVRDRAGVRLEACLASLAWQGVGEGGAEVVLADFGSGPAAAAEIAALAASSGAVLVRSDTTSDWNRARALNIGIRASSGRQVLCTDADMLFAPDFLATVLAALAARAALVLCRCHDLPADLPARIWQKEDYPSLLARASVRQTSGTGACQAAPRAFFERVRGYDEGYVYWGAEDNDLCFRARKAGLDLVWVSERTSMLHQWHPTMKNDRWLRRKLNEWRYRLTRGHVVKNPRAWGEV